MAAAQLDPQLLEILACPAEDHAPLELRDEMLACTSCGRRYPIVDGIPVLLLTEAELAEPTVGPEAEPTVLTEAELAEPTVDTEAELAEPTVDTEALPPAEHDPETIG